MIATLHIIFYNVTFKNTNINFFNSGIFLSIADASEQEKEIN